MNEKDKKIKLLLCSLYVLSTYDKDQEPTRITLNFLILNTVGIIEQGERRIENKEKLVNHCKDDVKAKIKNKIFSNGEVVEFKIGDIITTGRSSSMISLKFIFEIELDKNSIKVFKNNKLDSTIDI